MRPLSIIGRGCRWEIGAGDTSRERWIVSSAFFDNPVAARTVDKIFNLHNPSIFERGLDMQRNRLVVAWMAPSYRDCELLPVATLIEEFGPIFPSSINWMLAYALRLGYNDIELHGIDMKGKNEYEEQRDGLFYMLGICHGRGVKVKIPEYSGVYLAPEVYGVEV